MDPDRPLLAGHVLKEWQQRRVVQETSASIGVDEDPPHAELGETALGLLDGRLDIVHRYYPDGDDALWKAIGHVQDGIIRGDGQFRGQLRVSGRLLDGRHRVRNDLLVDFGFVHMPNAGIDIPEFRASIGTAAVRVPEQCLRPLDVGLRSHVCESVDLHDIGSFCVSSEVYLLWNRSRCCRNKSFP